MKYFFYAPSEFILSIRKNGSLINVLIKREILGRYKGSLFGVLWSFMNPLLMLLIYTFVFSIVFKARWSGGSGSTAEFALILFAGLIIFNLFAECLNRSPGLILANVNYVKKVIFPLEILPIISLGTAIFHAGVSYVVWLITYMFFYGLPHPTVLFIPFVIIPLVFFILGITWIFSSLGVYIRDLTQIIGIFTTILMFLSPIFYPISALPERFQSYAKFNPLASIIEQTRKVLFWGDAPDFFQYLSCLAISILVAILGFIFFQKTRKGFADVI
jgi:lipopolysaccharide transport system permease protein